MPLRLILGPPDSGRAALVRRRYLEAAERDPGLVLPTVDDVFAFERELCGEGAALGGTVLTFGALVAAALPFGGKATESEVEEFDQDEAGRAAGRPERPASALPAAS